MTELARIEKRGDTWRVVVLRSLGTAADAAWVSIGGCRSLAVAVRLWLAVVALGGSE